MTFIAGHVLHRAIAPPSAEVTFLVRGFHVGQPQSRDYLEQVGRWFLDGLEYGMTIRGEHEIATRLETLPQQYRGFAYEGASMALAILDSVFPWPGRRLQRFIGGPAAHQIYTAHVGAGWALARLPRVLRHRVRLADPLLRWLALDGYGFHEAYFRTSLVVGEKRRPWLIRGYPGHARNAARVVDQGIGRALWFVSGAEVERLADTIAGFAPDRRPDLWAGAGLAVVYAGFSSASGPADGSLEAGVEGCTRVLADDRAGVRHETPQALLREVALRAGHYLPDVALGAAFAAKARERAGLVTPHTVAAVRALCGMEVAEAARRTDDALPVDLDAENAYHAWRLRLRRHFAKEVFSTL